MPYLSDLCGTSVIVFVYEQQDITFKKKPLHSCELVFRLSQPPCEIFKHVKYLQNGFKICLSDPTDLKEAQTQFEQKLNLLNTIFGTVGRSEFINSVSFKCDTFIKNIKKNIRNEHGRLIPAYEVKSIFAEALTDYLMTFGIDVKCNIGRGTLYVGDEVVVNSGITQNTNLSSGVIEFLGFKAAPLFLRLYNEEFYKAPSGSYESGAWLNKLGDTPMELGYSALILDSLESFIKKMTQICDKNVAENNGVLQLLRTTSEIKEKISIELKSMLTPAEFDPKVVLSDARIKNSDSYKEIESLGLGENAMIQFSKYEAPRILLNEISVFIGAREFYIFNPDKANEKAENSGYVDELYVEHIALPHTKTRKAMLALKKVLEDPNSLGSFLFDAERIKLNIAGNSDYDHHLEEFKNERQYIDVCSGAKFPLVNQGEIIRFVIQL